MIIMIYFNGKLENVTRQQFFILQFNQEEIDILIWTI